LVAMYEDRVGDNHHHVICRSCGAIGDVDCAVGSAPCLTASNTHGFVIDEADVSYWGLCPACAPAQTMPKVARPTHHHSATHSHKRSA
jgi:Fe2+ or Zn2+ uptake regulation protein